MTTTPRTVPGELRTNAAGDLVLTVTLTAPTPAALAADALDVAGHLRRHLTGPNADRYVVEGLRATRAADEARR